MRPEEQIVAMATKSSDSKKRKANSTDERVLGRSALSGRYVTKPVKEGSVSAERIRQAVQSASKKKR